MRSCWAAFAILYLMGIMPLAWLPDMIGRACSITLPVNPPPAGADARYDLLSLPHFGALFVFLQCAALLHRQPRDSSRLPFAAKLASYVALILNALVLILSPGLGIPSWPGTIWQWWSWSPGSDDNCLLAFTSSLKHRQPSAWSAVFLDLHICLFLLPVGLLTLSRGGGGGRRGRECGSRQWARTGGGVGAVVVLPGGAHALTVSHCCASCQSRLRVRSLRLAAAVSP